MNKTITRSTVNTQDYSAPEFPKSGFNLGFRDYNDYMLGRWHTSGFQWVMPSDKISGHNKGNFTFNNFRTPMVAPTHVGQYNVYVTLRSIDNTFQENVAPSKHNGYSADWRMPMTNTRTLLQRLINDYFVRENSDVDGFRSLISDFIGLLNWSSFNPSTTTLDDWFDSSVTEQSYENYQAYLGDIREVFTASDSVMYQDAVKMYAVDALKDLQDFFDVRFNFVAADDEYRPSPTMLASSFFYNLFDTLLTPWLGRYSYFADFGYNYIRPSDIYRITRGLGIVLNPQISPVNNFLRMFDDTPMNEYPIRAMYAFWYDRCRDVNLQPVSSTLPNPRKFGSTSIFDIDAGGNLIYLLYRIRRWTEDMFISAQCDSPARHVFAPVYTSTATGFTPSDDINNKHTQESDTDESVNGRKLSAQNIAYLDPLTGSTRTVKCPVPSFVNDYLSHDNEASFDVYGLTLQNLRQAQNLERYLKRLDYFGDEYNDYMLAQYNSRVSDLRINHPEVLSQSIDDANYEQQISNVSTSAGSQVGDRTATGTITSGGDGYTTFTEEFGIIINVISFMPEASYDNACPQLLMSRLVDLPLPIFAANNDELGRIMEIAANGLSPAMNGDDADFRYMFGHYPAYHAWRSRVDRVRGSFLNERQDCLFRRFYDMVDGITTPRLNYEFINCRPNLQMFVNTVRYDCQLYGDVVHECYVERVLPTPVETI